MTNITPASAPFSKPSQKPDDPRFSSGPTAKRPGWSVKALEDACLGRSHRSGPAKAKIRKTLELMRELLGVPGDYRMGITAASDTGAVEIALWNLLGARPVDVFAWDAFGKDWVVDVIDQLKVPDARSFEARHGALPDLSKASPTHDVVFTWNGTTSGVRVPDAGWISDAREGLTICDATSAAFAMPLPWPKLDVVTFSWQKVLGGEAQHGVIILGPRAVARLESHKPDWPIPKIYRITKKGRLDEAVFQGDVINTCSLLCVEDALDALQWLKSMGGASAAVTRTSENFKVLERWVEETPWITFLARDPATRSPTSVCLSFCDPDVLALNEEGRAAFAKRVSGLLDKEGAALDAASYRDAPPGLRFWLGATVERKNVEALLPWLEWAYGQAKSELRAAA